METKTIERKTGTLTLRDVLIGAALAAASGVFTQILVIVQSGSLDFDRKAIGITALSAFLAYIGKNYFEPSKTVIIKE
ncbi:MAG TPA: hypothetical protein PKA53_08465 [Sphingobacterium sp.]|nr:hypothetical protein [Sphingobacterium sp.]